MQVSAETLTRVKAEHAGRGRGLHPPSKSMLTKSQARTFFVGGTVLFTAVFLALTIDSHTKIPRQTNADQITPKVAQGKRLWEHNNCMGCHTLFGEGAYYAPELTKVVERRGTPWLKVFLKDPQAM